MSSRQKGMTLVEVLVGIGILAILIFASLSLTTSSLQQTRLNMDRQFATQKAISILEELKSIAQANARGNSVAILDQYDDKNIPNNILTVQSGAQPGDPISGNVVGPLGWLYQRRVSVTTIGGQPGVRLVRVAMFRNDKTGLHLLAEVSSVLRTLATVMPPSQVYDVYAVAIDDVPGWWVYTSSLQQFVTAALNDLEARNPGLQFRIHWVTKLSYGRDQEYRPYINSANDSVADPGNNAYFYPGTLPTGATPPANNPPNLAAYYPPAIFKAHMNVDGTDTNGYDATANPVPYALADQFNNGMRYYDEKALFNARVAAGLEDPTTPTYRLLLDDMMLNPTAYTNAIVINLHGELFPFPPVRNYSDPAKLPDTTASPDLHGVRVVTHPEFLAYDLTNPRTSYNANSDVNLRVYSYEAPSGGSSLANGILPVPITVVIRGVDLTQISNTVSVSRIEGGVSNYPTFYANCSTNVGYCKTNALVTPTTASMYATVSVVNSGGVPNTVIKLFNSPVRAPKCTGGNCASLSFTSGTTNNEGLVSSAQYLYYQQYVPAPMEDFASATVQWPFAPTGNGLGTTVGDLTSTSTTTAKNTARWVININGTKLNTILNGSGIPAVGGAPACATGTTNAALTVETSIGDPGAGLPTSGVMWPAKDHPSNMSRTYVWRGTNLWLYGDGTDTNPPHLPVTERFQFLGDPRHDPYADNKMPFATNGNGVTYATQNVSTVLGMGYNRYFDDFENTHDGDQSAMWGGTGGWKFQIGTTWYGVKNDGSNFNDGWTPNTSGQPTPSVFGEFEIDIPRIFQVLRTSLTGSRTVYTTMTGFSYYYIGLGGEIGYDAANQFPNSIPVNSKPFTGSSGSTTEQSITNDLNWGDAGSTCNLTQGCGVKYIRSVGTVGPFNYWWSMTWLGELYPDAAYAGASGWGATGNLPTGTSQTNYKRALRGTISPGTGFILPSGTSFNGGVWGCASGNTSSQCYSGYNTVRRTLSPGSTSFFWTGSATSTFHHSTPTGTGSLVSDGLNVGNSITGYNYPLLNPISNNRPFSLTANSTGDNPESFLASVYGATTSVWEQARYYLESTTSTPGSALYSLRDPSTSKTAFVVVNGLSPAGTEGQSYIAHWSFLTLIDAYLQGGLYPKSGTETGCSTCTFRITQLPRVAITSPSPTTDLADPASVNVAWSTTWTRWDNQKYLPAYASGFSEATPIQYQIMFSTDYGVTWQWADCGGGPPTGTPVPGTPTPAALTTSTTCSWQTPSAQFPTGDYIIRVEAYRQGFALHYSYHQFRAFIHR